MTEHNDERRPLIRPAARRTVLILLAANLLTYGVFYVALHAMAAQ
jgi:hypothetical protein